MEVLYNRLAMAAPLIAVVAAIVVLVVTHADASGQVASGLLALAGVLANGLLNALSQSAHLRTLHPPSTYAELQRAQRPPGGPRPR